MGSSADLTSRWLRQYAPVAHPRLRLLCFPHAGGTASFFRSWPGRFPADVEVLSVRYPGRQDRANEPFIDQMEPLADSIVEALEPVLDRPLAFFGHSMGASIAHEVALRLESRHAFALHRLMVSARPAPHLLGRCYPHLDSDEAIIADVRRLHPDSSSVLDDPDLRELVLPAIRADYRLVGTYSPSVIERVSCPIAAYTGDGDPDVSPERVAGWSEASMAEFSFRVFPGDHFYLVPQEKELVAEVLRQL